MARDHRVFFDWSLCPVCHLSIDLYSRAGSISEGVHLLSRGKESGILYVLLSGIYEENKTWNPILRNVQQNM